MKNPVTSSLEAERVYLGMSSVSIAARTSFTRRTINTTFKRRMLLGLARRPCKHLVSAASLVRVAFSKRFPTIGIDSVNIFRQRVVSASYGSEALLVSAFSFCYICTLFIVYGTALSVDFVAALFSFVSASVESSAVLVSMAF